MYCNDDDVNPIRIKMFVQYEHTDRPGLSSTCHSLVNDLVKCTNHVFFLNFCFEKI